MNLCSVPKAIKDTPMKRQRLSLSEQMARTKQKASLESLEELTRASQQSAAASLMPQWPFWQQVASAAAPGGPHFFPAPLPPFAIPHAHIVGMPAEGERPPNLSASASARQSLLSTSSSCLSSSEVDSGGAVRNANPIDRSAKPKMLKRSSSCAVKALSFASPEAKKPSHPQPVAPTVAPPAVTSPWPAFGFPFTAPFMPAPSPAPAHSQPSSSLSSLATASGVHPSATAAMAYGAAHSTAAHFVPFAWPPFAMPTNTYLLDENSQPIAAFEVRGFKVTESPFSKLVAKRTKTPTPEHPRRTLFLRACLAISVYKYCTVQCTLYVSTVVYEYVPVRVFSTRIHYWLERVSALQYEQ